MSIENKNIDGGLPKFEVHPANEIVADPNHAWHAIRGYDFAGLEQILTNGLLPADNQGDYSVSLSASPAVSQSVNREANSFYAYTLQDGLSLSVSTPYVAYPSGDYGGFADELRRTSVSTSDVDGVMLPSHTVDQRLVDILTIYEARMPKQAVAYVERTLQHLSDLGAEVDTTTVEMATDAINVSNANSYLAMEDTQRLEGAFMKAYAGFLQKDYGIPEPTVGDMLAFVLDRAQRTSTVDVYSYDEALKKEVGSANVRIAAKTTSSRHLSGMSLSDWL